MRLSSIQRSAWVRQIAHLLGIVSICFLVFSNTLENTYHLDSVYRIEQNTEIDRFWPPSRFFTDARTGSTIPQIAEYRPLMPLSHAINNELSRMAGIPKLAGYHIGNIAIHAFTAIVAYYLFGLLLRNFAIFNGARLSQSSNRLIAFFGALLFAIHPIAGSAVNYLAARDLLLMVAFLVSAMLVYTSMRTGRDSALGWLAALALVSLAILSKQAAITAFGFVFLFEWLLKGARLWDWRLWGRTLLFALPTIGYFVLRFWFAETGSTDTGLRTPTGFSYPISMLDAHLFYYLRNFVWPFEMRVLAQIEIHDTLLSAKPLIGLAFIIATLAAAGYFRKRQPLVSFCILAYWGFMALESSIFPFRFEVTDYRQYLSSVFLCLLVALAIGSVRPKPVAWALAILLAGYFATSTYALNRNWATEESLWAQSVRHGGKALAHHNYAMSIVDSNPELAREHYEQALSMSPNHIYASIGLAMLELRMGETDQALQRLNLMVALNPTWGMPRYWLAVAYETMGDRKAALPRAVEAADLDRRSLRFQHKAATLLQRNGRQAEAIEYFKRVVRINPDFQQAEFALAFAYQKAGRSSEAIATYKSYLERNPEHIQARFNLGYELRQIEACQTAIEHLEAVLNLRPAYREAHLYIAQCHDILGDRERADLHLSLYRDRAKPAND